MKNHCWISSQIHSPDLVTPCFLYISSRLLPSIDISIWLVLSKEQGAYTVACVVVLHLMSFENVYTEYFMYNFAMRDEFLYLPCSRHMDIDSNLVCQLHV